MGELGGDGFRPRLGLVKEIVVGPYSRVDTLPSV
jgi:hypothetical protein